MNQQRAYLKACSINTYVRVTLSHHEYFQNCKIRHGFKQLKRLAGSNNYLLAAITDDKMRILGT